MRGRGATSRSIPSRISPLPAADSPPSLVQRLQQAQSRLAATALVVMMLATVVDVFFRYAFNKPLRISYDLIESMMVIYVFHGMAAVFLKRRNIAIDLIDSFAGGTVIRFLIVVADGLSIACLVILAWAMTGPALQAFNYGDRKLELGLPLYVLWAVALLGIAGTILCALAAAFAGPANREGHPR
jgi:TRAP-type C4-dicarboxylate transport system permease small subunit